MEEKDAAVQSEPVQVPKKKSDEDPNATIKAVCLFLGIIVLCAAGYIVYDKFIAKHDETQCIEAAKDDKAETGKPEEKTDDNIGFRTEVGYGEIYVNKAGEVYLIPHNYVDNSDYLGVDKIDFDEKYAPGKAGKYLLKSEDFGGYIFYENPVDEGSKEKEFNGYKLDLENIVAVLDVEAPAHQWWGWTTAFIDKDGNVSWMRVDPNRMETNGKDYKRTGKAAATIVKNYSAHKNIATIINDYDYGKITLVTKDGGHIIESISAPFETEE